MNHLWLRTMLFNTPLLLHGDYLSQVLSVISERLNITNVNTFTGDHKPFDASHEPHRITTFMQMMDGEVVNTESLKPTASNSIAIIPILGSLVQRGGGIQSDSTTTRGYDEIKSAVLTAAQTEGIGGAILRVDSPGGVHHGCSETSEAIRRISTEMNFPLWTSIEGSCMSAAMNLGSAGSVINAQPSSYAGSIGAFIAHTSVAEAMERAGIEVTVVKSGAKKAAGIASEKLSPATIADLQLKVNAARDQFIQTVVSHREGVTTQSILSQEAGWFTAQDAVAEGLVDQVGSSDDFYQEFFEHINSKSTAVSLAAQPGNSTETHSMKVEPKAGDPIPEITAQDVTEAKAEGIKQGAADAADRYGKIYAHANASVDAAFTAQLAADTSVSVEIVSSMLDRMASPKAAEPVAPTVATDEQLITKFGTGALDGISANEKSILHKVYARSPGPDLPLDNYDPTDAGAPQNAKPKTKEGEQLTPWQQSQAKLNQEFGAPQMALGE